MPNRIFVFILFVALVSCQEKETMDIQGHRGYRGLYPENSLLGFQKALDIGVTTLELDIALTKDNQLIVTHEPYINPLICLDPEGNIISDEEKINIYKLTHNEIKAFDCGLKFHPKFPDQLKVNTYKPLLSEVFELVRANNSEVHFNIEIKSDPAFYELFTPNPAEYVQIVLNEIEKSNLGSRINLQSFDINILEEIHKQNPDIEIAILIDEDESIDGKTAKLSFKPEIISPYFKLLDKSKVSHLHNDGFKVIPWTVNEEEDLKTVLNYNVDGIITDYPDRLIALLN